MIRAWARSQRRVSSCRRYRSTRRTGVIGKDRPSRFLVVPGSSRTKPPFQSTWDHVSEKTSARRHPVTSPKRTPSATSGLRRLQIASTCLASANVVFRQELDARHRGDDIVVQAEPVGGAERSELAI